MTLTFSIRNMKICLCYLIFLSIGVLTYSSSLVYAKFTCDQNTGKCVPVKPTFTCDQNTGKCVPAGSDTNTPSGSNETGTVSGKGTNTETATSNGQFQTIITIEDAEGHKLSNSAVTTSDQVNVRLSGSSPHGVSDFQCKITYPDIQTSWSSVNCGENPFEIPRVVELSLPGDYVFQARVIDKVTGDPDPSPAEFTWAKK